MLNNNNNNNNNNFIYIAVYTKALYRCYEKLCMTCVTSKIRERVNFVWNLLIYLISAVSS